MSIGRELYNLQEIDRELASCRQAHARILDRLKGNPEIAVTAVGLDVERKKLEELARQQRSLELEIDSISSKVKKFEEELYSGRTSNPKELSGLQQEIENLKSGRGGLEDKELELMEAAEQSQRSVAGIESRLKELNAAWSDEQKQLNEEKKETEKKIAALQSSRDSLAGAFESDILAMYEELKRQKGTAVAEVERGICRGCRIQLPVNELQQVRSGTLTRCGSCGRILFTSQ